MNHKRTIVGPKAVRAVMRRIEGGTLRPGDRIVPRDIAQRLGTSDIPVREAFHQLVGRDILVERHGEGFFIAPITSAMLRTLYLAHGRVIDALLRGWRIPDRLGQRFGNPWRLFQTVAQCANDDALAGMQSYIAGRLALARGHETAHAAHGLTTRTLMAALRDDDINRARRISYAFHGECATSASRIWQSMTDR